MKFRMWWLVAVGVLLMGVGMLGSRSVLNAGQNILPPGMDLVNVTANSSALANGNTLTLADVAAMQTAVQGSRLSWWAKGSGTIGTDTRNTQADIYAVSGSFQDFHRMVMMYGSFLPRNDMGNGIAVVLDSDLAYRLFGTYNAVGLELQYQGRTFQVCGVVKADKSILGLMSGDGQFSAYISGYDLISTNKLTLGGFEAEVPAGAPGQAVQTIQSAMQTQGVSTGSFLLEDMTEKIKMNAQAAALPAALLAAAALCLLLAIFVRSLRGAWRESLEAVHDDYFRNVSGALALRLVKLLALLAASAGAVWLIWTFAGLKFFLPSRYIPGSWIDTTFYTGLIQSESQTALAAQGYPRDWWYSAWSASAILSQMLSILSYVGIIVTALSLHALSADRRAAAALNPGAARPGALDVPALWLLAILSYGVYTLVASLAELPVYPDMNVLYALMLGLAVWVASMHKGVIESLFYKKVEKREMALDETEPLKGRRMV